MFLIAVKSHELRYFRQLSKPSKNDFILGIKRKFDGLMTQKMLHIPRENNIPFKQYNLYNSLFISVQNCYRFQLKSIFQNFLSFYSTNAN